MLLIPPTSDGMISQESALLFKQGMSKEMERLNCLDR